MGESKPARRVRIDWVITIVAAIVLIVLLVSASRNELSRNPVREASIDFGRDGFVTIQFSTDPYPPLPTGMVSLSFMPMNSRGQTVALDDLVFEYGLSGSDHPLGSGIAERMPDGSGMFMASAQFPSVGDWWLRARARLGQTQGEVQFSFYVEPAQ